MPVNINNIKNNFSNILKNWFDLIDNYDFSIDFIVIDGFYNKNNLAGYKQYKNIIDSIINWQKLYGKNKEFSEKNFMIHFLLENISLDNEEDCKIIKHLKIYIYDEHNYNIETLKKEDLSELGKILKELRNLLTHYENKKEINREIMNRKIKYSNSIIKDPTKLYNIYEILHTLLINAIYKKIGIELNLKQKEKLYSQMYTRIWYER